MKTKMTSSTPLSYSTTVGDLSKFLAPFPTHAKVKVGKILGDRPGDSDSYTLTVTWETEI